MSTDDTLADRIRACRLCADRFAGTATAHAPRPLVWFRTGTPILVAGQAPGLRVHESGRPFDDPSGRRLRHWMGVDEATFWDRARLSFLPTALCFPGYSDTGADLPPPPVCWRTWHARALAEIGRPRLTLLVGAHAVRRHLGHRGALGAALADWRRHAPAVFVLPHPSWRNNAWLARNPWFEADVVPALRTAVRDALGG